MYLDDSLHPKFQMKHGLTDDDIEMGQEEFLKPTANLMLPRQKSAVWLELCNQRKRKLISNWKVGLWVSDCGSNLGWLSIVEGMFPCLRPGNQYLLVQNGEPKIATGPEWLAVPGIGVEEAEAFNLLLEDDALLRTLVGNAFCANICCAFLVAGILAL